MRSFPLSAAVSSLLLLRVAGQGLVEKQGSCPDDQVCATKNSCPYWVNWENRVKEDRSSPEFQQYVAAAKGALCNKRERATCCPLLDRKPGSCPAAGKVCATRASCPFWVDWENRVKDDRNSPEFQQYLAAAKGALCNKRERATCCWGDPLEVDVRLMFYACTYVGKVVAQPWPSPRIDPTRQSVQT